MKLGIAVLLSAAALLAALLGASAHAQNNAAATAAAQVGATPQRGALYRIHHRGQTSYLFGTIHVGDAAFFPLEPEVTRALARASMLVLEIDVRNDALFQAALQKHGVYREGDSVAAHLSPPALAQLQTALRRFGLDYAAMQRFKPWLLANLLLGLDLERGGYRRAHGIEMFLLSLAETKTVRELESADYQMSLFDGMDDASQERYLLEQLAELEDGNALKKAQAMIDAWARGDGAAAERLMLESLGDKSVSSEFIYRVLLEKRNPEMAEKISSLLEKAGSESAFVGVGLLHLLGEGGVPALLRGKGYEVEKVY